VYTVYGQFRNLAESMLSDGEHKVAVVDTKTLQTLARVGPLNTQTALRTRRAAASIRIDEHGDVDAVIDTKTNSLVAASRSEAAPATPSMILVQGTFWLRSPEERLVAIDPANLQIIGHYPMTGIESPHGIALDQSGRLAFVAGEENHMLAVVDLNTMKVLATHPVW